MSFDGSDDGGDTSSTDTFDDPDDLGDAAPVDLDAASSESGAAAPSAPHWKFRRVDDAYGRNDGGARATACCVLL